MAEDQQFDPQFGNQLGQHVDRLADDQVVDHREPFACQMRVRFFQVGLHVIALVGERNFRHVFSGQQVRGRIVHDAGEVHLRRRVGREAHQFVQRRARFRRAVVRNENFPIHN